MSCHCYDFFHVYLLTNPGFLWTQVGKTVLSIDFSKGVTFSYLNLLTAHLFHALAGSQTMGLLDINVSKRRTISAILTDKFPVLSTSGSRGLHIIVR
jgi:hypothetical protein